MSSRPLDTTPATWAQYETVLDRYQLLAAEGVDQKLSEAVQEIRLAGIRSRHPELMREEVVALLVAEDHGVVLPGQK